MAAENLLQKRVAETPTIYAYEHIGYPAHKGWLKVGYTTRDVETRVREQNQTGNIQYRIVLKRPAMRKDGSSFTDKLVHRILRKDHIRNPEGEWFVCDIKKVEQAIAMRSGINWGAVALPSLFKKRPINGAPTKMAPTKHITKKTVILPAHFDLL